MLCDLTELNECSICMTQLHLLCILITAILILISTKHRAFQYVPALPPPHHGASLCYLNLRPLPQLDHENGATVPQRLSSHFCHVT